jgi:hypothetical protein
LDACRHHTRPLGGRLDDCRLSRSRAFLGAFKALRFLERCRPGNARRGDRRRRLSLRCRFHFGGRHVERIVGQGLCDPLAELGIRCWRGLTELELLTPIVQQRKLVQGREPTSQFICSSSSYVDIVGASHWRRAWLRGWWLLGRTAWSPSSHRCDIWNRLYFLHGCNFLNSNDRRRGDLRFCRRHLLISSVLGLGSIRVYLKDVSGRLD